MRRPLIELTLPTRLALMVALVVVCACVLVACADKRMGSATPVAVALTSQDDALQQAKDADLPALKAADRAVVSEVPPPMGTGKWVEITDTARIRRLVDVLKPTKAPPSAGEQEMTVRFYQGPTLLREVWVYGNGEWGFRRPGTSWTTGLSEELVRLIRQELAGVTAAR
jgi:hypothetical protein